MFERLFRFLLEGDWRSPWDTGIPDTTRIYAKVDLTALRQVADFDLGGSV